jgi:hypothetical protein
VSEQACPGSCNSRFRREQAAYKAALTAWAAAMAARAEGDPELPRPLPPGTRAWPGNPWCGRCQGVLRAQLAELDDLAALLAAIPDLSAPPEEARVSGSRDTPSPSPSMDDLDELAGWLRDWQSALQGSDPPARRGYLATAVTTGVHWLALHFDPLITHPDLAADFGGELRQWHRTLSAKAKAGTGIKHMKKPCPRCRNYTLWRADGDRYVKCADRDCGRMLSLEEFEALDAPKVA